MSYQYPYPPPIVNGNNVTLDVNQLQHPTTRRVKAEAAKHMADHTEAKKTLGHKKP